MIVGLLEYLKMNKRRSILSTSLLESDALQITAAAGIEMDTIPFISVSYIESDSLIEKILSLAAQKLHVVFTSKHAVKAVKNILNEKEVNWSIFCLGSNTKNIVNQCFKSNNLIGFAHNAADLAIEIGKEQLESVVFFCGDLRLDTLPDRLTKLGVKVQEKIVYRSIATPHKAEKEYDGILFFSPSGVHSFFGSNVISGNTTLFAIGQTTAEVVSSYSDNILLVSEQPSKMQVVTDAVKYFSNK